MPCRRPGARPCHCGPGAWGKRQLNLALAEGRIALRGSGSHTVVGVEEHAQALHLLIGSSESPLGGGRMSGRGARGKSSRNAGERGGAVTSEGGDHTSVIEDAAPTEEEETSGLVSWR
jgi:hypothetical protein